MTRLRSEQMLSVMTLAEDLAVSDETIRRELRALEDLGLVMREHGGVRITPPVVEGPLHQRMEDNAEAKRRIARAAVDFVPDGAILFIDAGTTSLFVAQQLAERQALTVVTNSLQVAQVLGGINDNRLFLAGGEMDYAYCAFSDHTAQAYVAGFTPHLAILSVGGLSVEHGLMEFHPSEAAMARIAHQRSKKVLLVTDSSKFGRYALIQTGAFSDVDILVTDKALDDSFAHAFAHAEVVVA